MSCWTDEFINNHLLVIRWFAPAISTDLLCRKWGFVHFLTICWVEWFGTEFRIEFLSTQCLQNLIERLVGRSVIFCAADLWLSICFLFSVGRGKGKREMENEKVAHFLTTFTRSCMTFDTCSVCFNYEANHSYDPFACFHFPLSFSPQNLASDNF